jgi:hypothetical protein
MSFFWSSGGLPWNSVENQAKYLQKNAKKGTNPSLTVFSQVSPVGRFMLQIGWGKSLIYRVTGYRYQRSLLSRYGRQGKSQTVSVCAP